MANIPSYPELDPLIYCKFDPLFVLRHRGQVKAVLESDYNLLDILEMTTPIIISAEAHVFTLDEVAFRAKVNGTWLFLFTRGLLKTCDLPIEAIVRVTSTLSLPMYIEREIINRIQFSHSQCRTCDNTTVVARDKGGRGVISI